jgi:DNA polymerase delta subunit 1
MGCPNALIPARAVAETTTGIGRNDIQKVKEIAETMFTVERGYPANAVIVGGDTDSVFVKMPTQSTLGEKEAIQEAMDLAHALATEVNGVMQSPKRIAFEKVFRYLLLMKKKRYAGIKYENLTDKPQIDIKGIECVRRSDALA